MSMKLQEQTANQIIQFPLKTHWKQLKPLVANSLTTQWFHWKITKTEEHCIGRPLLVSQLCLPVVPYILVRIGPVYLRVQNLQ